jgi:hypothetical protein
MASIVELSTDPIIFFIPNLVFAAPSMPWDDSLLQIQHALVLLRTPSSFAIAMAGIAYAVGEHGSIFRRAAGIIFGGSIATGATSIYLALKLSSSGI